MATVKKILYAAITIAILILFIFIILSLFKKGDSDVNKGSEKYTEIAKDVLEADKTYYDDKVVPGQEVIDLIKRSDGEYLSIFVENGAGHQTYFIRKSSIDTSTGIAEIIEGEPSKLETVQSSKKNTGYINPDAKFKGKVFYDANGVVARIEFRQQK